MKVLPKESGIKKNGEEWEALPFVFEYFEKDNDRWSDKVFLRARDHKWFGMIEQYVERDKDGNGIVENGSMKLKSEIKCRCGFGHSVNEGKRKDGSGSYIINELRLYKFELLSEKGVAVVQQQTQQQAPSFAPTQEQPKQEESDDLPF